MCVLIFREFNAHYGTMAVYRHINQARSLDGKAVQQRSPQSYKQLQEPSSPAPSSPPKRGPVLPKKTSIEVSGNWFVGGLALLILCGSSVLSVWTPSSRHILQKNTKLRTAAKRKRQLMTPFDDQEASGTKQQIIAWLQNPSSSSSSINEDLQSWDRPLVHIVNTRFMQEQGHLKALGRARLHLFRTFCLPTMAHQSTQDFLWIIKIDPNLDIGILEDLIQDLKAHSNIYLVASNVNFMIRDKHEPKHSWRDGAEIEDLLRSTIYTGDPGRLYRAMLQKDKQVVLETRLDADDGLHKYYLQRIQKKALDQFGVVPHVEETTQPNPPPRWLYWCTRRHIEWHGGIQPGAFFGSIDNLLASSAQNSDYYGSLLVVQHSKLCITPGITVGFGIGTDASEVPIHSHDKLLHRIHSLEPEYACGYRKASDCLELVEDMLLVAVRARTPTSAGMQRVEVADGVSTDKNSTSARKKKEPPHPSPIKMYLFWDLLHDDFFVLREQIQFTNRYILNHMLDIAKDNLEGQCTSGHSCKDATKEKLLKIIEEKVGLDS